MRTRTGRRSVVELLWLVAVSLVLSGGLVHAAGVTVTIEEPTTDASWSTPIGTPDTYRAKLIKCDVDRTGEASWTWAFPGGESHENPIGLIFNVPGPHSVTASGTLEGEQGSDSITVNAFGGPISGNTHLELLYPESTSPVRTYSALAGQPAGTTYQWAITAGGDKAHITTGMTGASVDVKGDAPSAPNAVTLQLTYSHGGKSAVWEIGLTVEKPTKPNSTRGLPGNLVTVGAPDWACYRQVMYHAESQNAGYVFVNMLWNEIVTVWPDSPWPDVPIQGGRHTNANGDLPAPDHIGWSGYQWNGTDTMLFHWHQVITLGGWHGWDDPFWTNNMAGYETPNVWVNAAD